MMSIDYSEQAAATLGPALLTVEEFGQALGGVGRGYVYALLKTGAIRSVKLGRLRRIPVTEVQRYVDSLAASGGAA